MRQKEEIIKEIVAGQASWRLTSSTMEAYITEQGGHVAPVIFDRNGRRIKPYAPPPWSYEKLSEDIPPVLQVLRGDFFCMPFGGNDRSYRGELHPPHGETSNRKWVFRNLSYKNNSTVLHLSMDTQIRKSTVDKIIMLIDGHNAVYSRHVISGMCGHMTLGHHPTLRFPDYPESGLLSTSSIKYGMVSPLPLEQSDMKGYSILKPGEKFQSLDHVQMITGDYTDISRYPARRGFEDIVTLITKPVQPFAWSAVVFPKERYVWFSLKDPAVLKFTLLWMSNGGRHYPPWDGRHINVMGIEEVTSFFHYGLAESLESNILNDLDEETYIKMSPRKPTVINFITAVALIPEGFDRVKKIIPGNDETTVVLISENGQKIETSLDYKFLGVV